MEKKQFTKFMLIFMFIGFYISSIILLSLDKGNSNVGILFLVPALFLGGLINFLQRRFREKGEKVSSWSIFSTIFLLMLPFINLFILYDVVADGNRHGKKIED